MEKLKFLNQLQIILISIHIDAQYEHVRELINGQCGCGFNPNCNACSHN